MSRNRGGGHFPSYEEICCASVLAASDYLTNVKWMWLKNMTIPNTVNVDITHIARLASIVEEGVHLDNVTGDKTLLLKNICSKELKLSNIELNHLETRYVVQCLQSSIDVVHLGSSDGPEIVLDFQTFKEYDGNGKCHKILCYSDTCDAQLIHQLKAWATDVNWEMKMGKYIAFKRPPQNSIMQNKLKEMAMKLQSSLRDDSHDLTSMDYEAGFQLIMKGGYLSEHEVNLISNKIQSSWSNHRHYPSNAEVFCAAALATTGNLANVQWMWLNDMEIPKTNVIDITHITKLAANVIEGVHLDGVNGDIVEASLLLKSIQSKALKLSNLQLDRELTLIVVQCLKSSVKKLVLGRRDGPVTLHQTFKKYNGRGMCHEIQCYSDTRRDPDNYMEFIQQLKTWMGNTCKVGNRRLQIYDHFQT